jgi:hypothetical protein
MCPFGEWSCVLSVNGVPRRRMRDARLRDVDKTLIGVCIDYIVFYCIIYIYIYIYIYNICVCVCVYIYIYIYMYIQAQVYAA